MVTNIWPFQPLRSHYALLRGYLLINSLNASIKKSLGYKSPCGGAEAIRAGWLARLFCVVDCPSLSNMRTGPGGDQLLVKVNEEVLKYVGTPHLSCMSPTVQCQNGFECAQADHRTERAGRWGGWGRWGTEPCSCQMSNTNCRASSTESWRRALEESLISPSPRCSLQELMRDRGSRQALNRLI